MREENWDRHEEEASESLLISVVDQLDYFDFYVLDKILEYTRQPTVLDVRYYANDPEILALLEANQLTMLRLFPSRTWETSDYIGMYHPTGGNSVPVMTIDDAKSLAELGQVDLTVLHHQDPGYEHYDCIGFTDVEPRLSDHARTRFLQNYHQSSLVAAMTSGNTLGAIRMALTMLGKSMPGDSDSEEGCDGRRWDLEESGGSEQGSEDPCADDDASAAETDKTQCHPCKPLTETSVGEDETETKQHGAADAGPRGKMRE